MKAGDEMWSILDILTNNESNTEMEEAILSLSLRPRGKAAMSKKYRYAYIWTQQSELYNNRLDEKMDFV